MVVDGPAMSRVELRVTLQAYEGWSFWQVMEDRFGDGRSDAEIIVLRVMDPCRPADA